MRWDDSLAGYRGATRARDGEEGPALSKTWDVSSPAGEPCTGCDDAMKRAIHSLFKTFGYRVVRIEDDAGVGPRASERLWPLLAGAEEAGIFAAHIVDVGANDELWTRAIAFFRMPTIRWLSLRMS